MNRLSFLGETPTEALRNAQIECGEDAIVISTKKIANANGYNKDMYEIVVAVEDEEIQNDGKIDLTLTQEDFREKYDKILARTGEMLQVLRLQNQKGINQ